MESERLYYREVLPSDDESLFSMDSDSDVFRYMGKKPLAEIQESRKYITDVRQQYSKDGLGRRAVILKETGEFIGWAGLKLEHNVNGHASFYDIGYRFMKKHWGKGYATEAARFFTDYAFTVLQLEKINGCVMMGNTASRRVLEKAGLQFVEEFDYLGTEKWAWYEKVNRTVPLV